MSNLQIELLNKVAGYTLFQHPETGHIMSVMDNDPLPKGYIPMHQMNEYTDKKIQAYKDRTAKWDKTGKRIGYTIGAGGGSYLNPITHNIISHQADRLGHAIQSGATEVAHHLPGLANVLGHIL